MSQTIIEPEKMLAKYGKSFNWAAFFLHKSQKNAAKVIYAFCRYIDDIADELPNKQQAWQLLKLIKQDIVNNKSENIIVSNMLKLMKRLSINKKVVFQLVDGISWDLQNQKIDTEIELFRYCYGVASTVGLLMCAVFKVSDANALRYAVDLGIAMQLTNIARDVKEDAQRNRLYIPQDWFSESLSAETLLQSKQKQELAFLQVQKLLKIADNYYQSANLGLRYLPFRIRFSITVAANLYRFIGQKILLLSSDQYWKLDRVHTNKSEKIYSTVASLYKFVIPKKISPHKRQLHFAIEDLINEAL